jgi:sensor domain CHASE-containing protein
MTFTQRDLVKLQLPLIGALLLLVIAGLLAWWSLLDAQKAEQQRNVAENSKNQIEQRLRQVRTEEQEIKERAQLFQQLQKGRHHR